MKLVDLLRTKFVDGKEELRPDELKEMITELKECDEFEKTDLVIMDLPVAVWVKADNTQENINAMSYLLREDTTFEGISYLYTISLTPEVFDSNDVHNPVKDGCSITPTMYNPRTFLPYRKIILDFQNDVETRENYRQALHDRLDDILNNEREYTIKGKRGVMLRGNFPNMKMSNNVNANSVYL
jgi:hypothetical protein